MIRIVGLLVFAVCIATCTTKNPQGALSVNAFQYTIQKKVECRAGAVVSAHPLASEVGVAIMKMGGNAFDAAIATQLALAVVYPEAGNIGGGGFTVGSLADGRTLAIDYRETAPGKSHRDMYLDSAGNALLSKSQHGHLAAGVPGAVAGIFATYKYAKLPFEKLIDPAIELAEKGFAITEGEARGLNRNAGLFAQYSTMLPAFVKTGGWKAGDTLVQKDLANTLKRIRDKGQAGFYEGETARLIVEEMQRGGGIMSAEDLKNYTAKERPAVVFDYKGYSIITMPLPSSGGVLLPQMMNMIATQPVKDYGFLSLQSVQLMTEIERRAYADRAKYLGDADFFKVPVQQLTSEAYARERMKDYDPNKAGSSEKIQAGILPESEETTHFNVYDSSGNAVAVTTTLNGGYGSHTVVGGAGFLLNNEMDDFSVKPGVPNMYGAVGAEANAIEAGKRMLSSMTPTIVLRDKKPYIITGTPGGTTITTSVFQTLVNLLEFGMSAEDAVNKPKFHHQWLPDDIQVERDFPKEISTQLEQMGYKITQRSTIGRTELILVWPDGKIEAVADKRGEDHAAGF